MIEVTLRWRFTEPLKHQSLTCYPGELENLWKSWSYTEKFRPSKSDTERQTGQWWSQIMFEFGSECSWKHLKRGNYWEMKTCSFTVHSFNWKVIMLLWFVVRHKVFVVVRSVCGQSIAHKSFSHLDVFVCPINVNRTWKQTRIQAIQPRLLNSSGPFRWRI